MNGQWYVSSYSCILLEIEASSKRPNKSLGLECYADANFTGGWNQADADNPKNVMSWTRYLIFCAGCPIGWCSKLQTKIALSMVKAKYITQLQSLQEVIPLMTLVEELAEICPSFISNPIVISRCMKIISLALQWQNQEVHTKNKTYCFEIPSFPSICWFQENSSHVYSIRGPINIRTKLLPESQFFVLRKILCGWWNSHPVARECYIQW